MCVHGIEKENVCYVCVKCNSVCVCVCVVISDPTHLLLLYQLHTIGSLNHCLEC